MFFIVKNVVMLSWERSRRNVLMPFCCVAAGKLWNRSILCRDATFRLDFVASLLGGSVWAGVFGRESLLGVCLEEICWDASGLEEGAVNGVAVGRECDSCEWSGCWERSICRKEINNAHRDSKLPCEQNYLYEYCELIYKAKALTTTPICLSLFHSQISPSELVFWTVKSRAESVVAPPAVVYSRSALTTCPSEVGATEHLKIK